MRIRRPLVLLGVVGVAVLLVAGCAPSPIQSVSFGDARLGLQGGSVRLPVRVTCQRGWNLAFGDVHVAQNNDGRLAQGFGFFENDFPGVPCTGDRQTISVLVTNSSPWVFKRGEAAADGTIAVFNEQTFELIDRSVDPQEIDILSSDSLLAPAPTTTTQPTRDPRYTRT